MYIQKSPMVDWYMSWFMVLKEKKIGSSKNHFCNLRVLLPGNQKYIHEYLRESEIIFKNILGVLHRGLGTIDSCKKPDIKNLMLQSL